MSIFIYSLAAELFDDMKPYKNCEEANQRFPSLLPQHGVDVKANMIRVKQFKVIVQRCGRVEKIITGEIKRLLIRDLALRVKLETPETLPQYCLLKL